MPVSFRKKAAFFNCLKNIFFLAIIFSSCTIPRKYQKDKPFLFKTPEIEVKGSNLSKDEILAIKQRLYSQLDDSAKVQIKDKLLILHFIDKPPAFDTTYAGISVKNMKASMMHIGYYKSDIRYDKPDTVHVNGQKRVTIKYIVNTGPATLIDTMSYRLNNADLQHLADSTAKSSLLVKGEPVTKVNIFADKGRLIDLYRNNGYYKFTSDDLQVIGDTTIASLTTISDNPFENLRLLAEAQAKRNKPTIKLATILNPGADSNRLKKYYINNVYIYPDFSTLGEKTKKITVQDSSDGYYIRHRKDLFKYSFLTSKMAFKKGDVYRQDDYAKTINNLTKTGVWTSVGIQTQEVKDSTQLDMYVRLVPLRKFGFEANIETSYSTNNNYALGNLLGFSGNLSLQNRNIKKKGIKMTTALRAGVEFNISKNKSTSGLINSNEIGITNTVSNPKLVWPYTKKNGRFLHILKLRPQNKTAQQSFINTTISYTNRIDLFNLQSLGLGFGYSWTGPKKGNWTFKPLNVEFSRLYNESQAFIDTLKNYPFLKYSFNTALVFGQTVNYNYSYFDSRINVIKLNLEQSGFPASTLKLFKTYLRKFAKVDVDFVSTKNHSKTSNVYHLFLGVGVPFGDQDKTLPFFKQYFSGGANSMRGWPIRGIGPGKVPLKPFGTNTFNDRTGDLKFEFNYEYRHPLVSIIPNSVVLKGAVFADFGNIWNLKNTKADGSLDSAQFKFANLYKELGVAAGYGLRLDFNYFLIRFDLGFRFKRPDLEANDGWKAPSLGFDNIFNKIFARKEKEWRYNNMNFTIGISYPF